MYAFKSRTWDSNTYPPQSCKYPKRNGLGDCKGCTPTFITFQISFLATQLTKGTI